MFDRCNLVNNIHYSATVAPSTNYTNGWLAYVSSIGTFYRSDTSWEIPTTRGSSTIPEGWDIVEWHPEESPNFSGRPETILWQDILDDPDWEVAEKGYQFYAKSTGEICGAYLSTAYDSEHFVTITQEEANSIRENQIESEKENE